MKKDLVLAKDTDTGYLMYKDQVGYITQKKISVMSEDGEEITDPNWYREQQDRLDFSWVNGVTPTIEEEHIWHANMPISLSRCKRVYRASNRGLPKRAVLALVFPEFELDKQEMLLFEMIYEHGVAVGLNKVAEELYEGAKCGDPRAVKMYLEVSGLLIQNEEDKDESARKKMMKITFDI